MWLFLSTESFTDAGMEPDLSKRSVYMCIWSSAVFVFVVFPFFTVLCEVIHLAVLVMIVL